MCPDCAAEAHGLSTVAMALRAAAAQRASAVDSRELDSLAAGVVGRFRAEQDGSISHTLKSMFEDLHLVWAALGATAATFACLAITVGIFYFSRAERPGSLAALINALSNPGTNAYPMQVDDSTILPRQDVPSQDSGRVAAVPEMTGDEDIMLDTTITREGRVASMELMNPEGPTGKREEGDWKAVGQVLDSVAQARFEPARVGGERVAVKMLWYLTHTTVRPKARGAVQRADSPTPTHIV